MLKDFRPKTILTIAIIIIFILENLFAFAMTVHYIIPLFVALILISKRIPKNYGIFILSYSLGLMIADNYWRILGA
jgi:hypothetical protein